MPGQPDPVVMPHDEVTGNPDSAVAVMMMMMMAVVVTAVDDDQGVGLRRGGSEGAKAEQAAEQNCEMMFHIGFSW